MKKALSILFILIFSLFSLFANDIAFLTKKVAEVSDELNLNLVITCTYRSWESQIAAMDRQSESVLERWYGEPTAKTFMNYKNGKISYAELLETMKDNHLIKHPNGLAVDIGVNSSGLSAAQVQQVKKALTAKGLYILDETTDGNPCIHVSRSY